MNHSSVSIACRYAPPDHPVSPSTLLDIEDFIDARLVRVIIELRRMESSGIRAK